MPDFLAVHDYGTGGIWVIIHARSEQEIIALYPELAVVKERPAWMTDAIYSTIKERMSFDLDQPPSGWLVDLIQARDPQP